MPNSENFSSLSGSEQFIIRTTIEHIALSGTQAIATDPVSYDGILPQEPFNKNAMQREFAQAAASVVILFLQMASTPISTFERAANQERKDQIAAIKLFQEVGQLTYAAAQQPEKRTEFESEAKKRLGSLYFAFIERLKAKPEEKKTVSTGFLISGERSITMSPRQMRLLMGNVTILTNLMKAGLLSTSASPKTDLLPPPQQS